MPQPSIEQVHIDQVLTNISVAFTMDQTDFIADKIFPVVPVSKQSDAYWVYPRGAWFRDEAEERAPGTQSKGGGWTLSNDTYYARRYSYHVDLDDPTVANADSVLNLEGDATRFVTSKLLLKRETLWIADFFKTGVWAKDITGVASGESYAGNTQRQWSDLTNAHPIEDIRNWKLYMKELTGYAPNVLVIGPRVLQSLLENVDLKDRIKYTQRGIITLDLLAAVLDVGQIYVPYAVKNTAKEGQADAYSFLYGKSALLLHVPPSPGVRVPSAGYTFAWTGLYGSGAHGGRIKRFRMEEIESDRIEGDMAFGQKVISAELGVFFTALVA